MKRFLLLAIFLCFAVYSYASDFKFGHCPITGNKIIENGRPTSIYRIIYFELSNGSVMPLAVDVEAINAITETDYPRIMQWVRDGWQWEINQKKWTPQQIQDYKDRFYGLSIVRRIE